MKNSKKRNYAIDFLRGCASISIILIHTAWCSGQNYLPTRFSNMFLFIDVPIFIFLSGLSYNYYKSISKNIKIILSQWNKWIFFLILYIAILLIFFKQEFDLSKLLSYIFYQVPDEGSLQVVGKSLWFITMYIKVTIFCNVILHFFNKNNNNTLKFEHLLIFMIFLSMINITYIDSYLSIYSFVYLLGYFSYNKKIDSTRKFILYEGLAIGIMDIIFYLAGYGFANIQDLKFPPTIYYLSASIPGILLTWFLKDRLKISEKNPICYIGRNAIFFYYSQGLASSILYFIEPNIQMQNIYIKFIILAGINIVMSITIGIIMNELYNITTKKLKKLKPLTYELLMIDNKDNN